MEPCSTVTKKVVGVFCAAFFVRPSTRKHILVDNLDKPYAFMLFYQTKTAYLMMKSIPRQYSCSKNSLHKHKKKKKTDIPNTQSIE
jgi:hypothetical protein